MAVLKMIVSSHLLLLESVWVQYQCVLTLLELLWICRTTCAKKKKNELVDKISWSFSTWLFVSLTAQEHTHLRTNILLCVSLHQRVPTRDPPASGMFRASIRVREGWRPAACLQRSQ